MRIREEQPSRYLQTISNPIELQLSPGKEPQTYGSIHGKPHILRQPHTTIAISRFHIGITHDKESPYSRTQRSERTHPPDIQL